MQADDRRDYEWVFRASFTSITRTVYLIVHDQGAAQEITQDAFIKLLEKWGDIAGYDRPEAWVRKVALRMAVRHVGRERRRPVTEARAQPFSRAAPSVPDPDVARAVRQLAPMQRAVVVLHYFEDRPVLEIARTLQVSESTVKQHLYRARSRLAQTLGEEVGSDVRG
jgi:RNA polymerase sigma-70 factor (ECF subfamily)